MNKPERPVSEKQVRKIVALGKKYVETAYPNPDRVGCPDPSLLRAMAYRDKRLTPAELPVSHVASCSPCFREYMRHRQSAKLLRALQVTGGSVLALGILLGSIFLVRSHLRRIELPSISQTPTVEQPQPVPRPPALPSPIAMTINLAQFSPTRGEPLSKTTNSMILPAKLIRATFLMPIGSEPGEYSVRLLRPNNEPLLDTRTMAEMKDGITSFEVDLNLQTLVRSRLQLMIRPPGLSWRTMPVFVE